MSATAEFVPIKSKRFVTLNAFDNWGEADLDGAIVRVRYEATESEAREIDHSRIREALIAEGASKVTIEPKIVKANRARAEQISEQLTPLDALAAYCDAEQVESGLRDRMVDTLHAWITA